MTSDRSDAAAPIVLDSLTYRTFDAGVSEVEAALGTSRALAAARAAASGFQAMTPAARASFIVMTLAVAAATYAGLSVVLPPQTVSAMPGLIAKLVSW